jgi:hypothetical protein
VPGLDGAVNVAVPELLTSTSNADPSSAVTVCSAASVFVTVTVAPADTDKGVWYAKSLIVIAVADAAGPDSVLDDDGIDDGGPADIVDAVGLPVAVGVLLPVPHPAVPDSITTSARTPNALAVFIGGTILIRTRIRRDPLCSRTGAKAPPWQSTDAGGLARASTIRHM